MAALFAVFALSLVIAAVELAVLVEVSAAFAAETPARANALVAAVLLTETADNAAEYAVEAELNAERPVFEMSYWKRTGNPPPLAKPGMLSTGGITGAVVPDAIVLMAFEYSVWAPLDTIRLFPTEIFLETVRLPFPLALSRTVPRFTVTDLPFTTVLVLIATSLPLRLDAKFRLTLYFPLESLVTVVWLFDDDAGAAIAGAAAMPVTLTKAPSAETFNSFFDAIFFMASPNKESNIQLKRFPYHRGERPDKGAKVT